MLEKEVTVTQVYKLLALFGEQKLTTMISARIETDLDRAIINNKPEKEACGSNDYSGYQCVSRASCQKKLNYICRSTC
jgi:hypothetical protein